MHEHPDLRDTLRMLRNENLPVRIVGLFIQDVIYERHGHARVSLVQIAQETGLSWLSSQRAVKRLMAIEFIERTRVGGKRNASVYRLLS